MDAILLTIAGSKKEYTCLRHVLRRDKGTVDRNAFPALVLGRDVAAKYKRSVDNKEDPINDGYPFSLDVDGTVKNLVAYHRRRIKDECSTDVHEPLIKAYTDFGGSDRAGRMRLYYQVCELRSAMRAHAEAVIEEQDARDALHAATMKVDARRQDVRDYIKQSPDAAELLEVHDPTTPDATADAAPPPIKRARPDDA